MKTLLFSIFTILASSIIFSQSLDGNSQDDQQNLPELLSDSQELDVQFENDIKTQFNNDDNNKKSSKKQKKNHYLKEGYTVQYQQTDQKLQSQYYFEIKNKQDFQILLQSDIKRKKSLAIKVHLKEHYDKQLFQTYKNYLWSTHEQEKNIESEYAQILQVNIEDVECQKGCIFQINTFGIGNLNLTAYYDTIYLKQNQLIVQNLEMGDTMHYYFKENENFYISNQFFTQSSYISVKILKNNQTVLMNKKIQSQYFQQVKNFKNDTNITSENQQFEIQVTALQNTEMILGYIDYQAYQYQLAQQQLEEDQWRKEEFFIIFIGSFFCVLAYLAIRFNQNKKHNYTTKRYMLIKNKFSNNNNTLNNNNNNNENSHLQYSDEEMI